MFASLRTKCSYFRYRKKNIIEAFTLLRFASKLLQLLSYKFHGVPVGRKYFYYMLPPKLTNMVKSLRERTAQNARSFKLSDRFERCTNSFF